MLFEIVLYLLTGENSLYFYVNSTGSKVRHNLCNKGYEEDEIYTIKV